MPESKNELFGEIFEFDKYICEMKKHVDAVDKKEILGLDWHLLVLYRDLLDALEETTVAITKVWDI